MEYKRYIKTYQVAWSSDLEDWDFGAAEDAVQADVDSMVLNKPYVALMIAESDNYLLDFNSKDFSQ